MDRSGRGRGRREPDTEGQLLAALGTGDRVAGDEIVRRYDRLVAAAARRVLCTAADVEDVVQETFLVLLVSGQSIREPERLGPWLWTTATNLARRTARHNLRHDPLDDVENHLAPESGAFDDVERELERVGQSAALHEAMAAISFDEQRLIRLLTTEKRPSYAAISAEMARPVGSLGPTRRRILGKLRGHPAMARIAVAA